MDSNKRTGPTVGFGTAKRWPTGERSTHKQYISREHTHNSPGQERTPGASSRTHLSLSSFLSSCRLPLGNRCQASPGLSATPCVLVLPLIDPILDIGRARVRRAISPASLSIKRIYPV